jgi:hypothetical protein
MTTPKWVHNKIQPIAVDDVLYYLAAAATAPVPKSRSWDIGGPDVLEYGDMMQIYAQVAGLGNRYLFVLPFLTPTIASLWVGAVTPIPPGLARPLVESLECDAVMRNSDIDSIIEPPQGGLTGYRRAVELALHRAARGVPEPSWSSLRTQPADALPSDPDWAGETVYTDVYTAAVAAEPASVWKAAQDAVDSRAADWDVEERAAGSPLRLRSSRRAPGREWLEIAVGEQDAHNSRYTQRHIFVPRGIAGRVYWFAVGPVRRAAMRALAREVVGSVR